MFLLGRLVTLALVAVTSACGGGAELVLGAIRLVDRFTAGTVDGSLTITDVPDGIAWAFGGETPVLEEEVATWGWRAGPDVTGLAVRDGALTGRATGAFPVLVVEGAHEVDERDGLYAVDIRLRVSDGENLSLAFAGGDAVELDGVQQQMAASLGLLSTPLRAGDTFETYTILPQQSVGMASVRHLLLRSTDADGATFEIEHLRVTSRKEHLAAVASGIGWQGLDERYHEALVARSPETLKFDVDLPSTPWLDLSMGTPEDGPVTFHVALWAGGVERSLLEQTVTTPYRWERRRVDLGDVGGETVTITLSLTAESDGTLGFWGSPRRAGGRGVRAGSSGGSARGPAAGGYPDPGRYASERPPRGLRLRPIDGADTDRAGQ